MAALFGYVVASMEELNEAQRQRWGSIYCGICRRMGQQCSQLSRLALRYDCAFLALLLMSLYEPQEAARESRCLAHPVKKRLWVDCDAVRYAADMNVALACYKAQDDWRDDKKLTAKALSAALKRDLSAIEKRYPRQCAAMKRCIQELSRLEGENCPNIDQCAGCFGQLMEELLVYREDLWAPTLRSLGNALGRFIYLADAANDFARDEKKGKFNAYLAAGCRDSRLWRQHLLLTMGRVSQLFESLPLVQDKDILDNIIYSGVWTQLQLPQEEEHA